MKKIRYLIFVPFLWTLAMAVPAWGENAPEGDYILFNGLYNSAVIQKSSTTVFLEKRLFRIDKKSGDTWMLIDQMRNGEEIKYWKKISENHSSK